MSETKICPQCGDPLPADLLHGLCPACLLLQGAASESAPPPPPFHAPAPAELAALFPQLEILELLGKGGMGAVYKARQPALDRFVALKILAPGASDQRDFESRFTREARALARLSHPAIVGVHEFGQAGGLHFFIMEYVDGANLRQLEKAGRLSPREALQIVPQICDALQYAHDEGVVHRDIKPENVLIDRKGRVKIADFGLAKILGINAETLRLTAEGHVMGTPHYMAPEQIEHPLDVDHRADIYSLGVVFYEMLTGELPIGKFAAPSRKVQIDARLDEVVLRALEKEPELRYQQASEVKTGVETLSSPAHMSGSQQAAARESNEASAGRKERFTFNKIAFASGGVLIVLVVILFSPTISARALAVIGGAILILLLILAAIAAFVNSPSRTAPSEAAVKEPLAPAVPEKVRLTFKSAALGCLLGGVALFILMIFTYCAARAMPAMQRQKAAAETARAKVEERQRVIEQRENAMTVAARQPDGSFRANLPQGSIELVAVSEHPSTGRPWWRPDGSHSPEGPFGNPGNSVSAREGLSREFVFKARDLPRNASQLDWDFTPAASWNGGNAPMVNSGSASGYYHLAVAFQEPAETVTAKVGAAMGAWETVMDNPALGGAARTLQHDGAEWMVSFLQPVEKPGGEFVIHVTHTSTELQTRVVAVDHKGEEHASSHQLNNGMNQITQITATFSKPPLPEVKSFRLQTRPYSWVRFPGVVITPRAPAQQLEATQQQR